MKPTLPLLLALLPALAMAQAQAQAQKVYRCGPDGREYSQTPCRDGVAIDAADPRSAADQKAARDVAAREARMADELTRERHVREAAAEKKAPVVKPAKPAASAPHKKTGKAKSHADEEAEAKMSPPMRLPTAK